MTTHHAVHCTSPRCPGCTCTCTVCTGRRPYESANVQPIPQRSFTVTQTGGIVVFGAEASSLGRGALGAIYNDAADLGLAVLTDRGNEIRFTLAETHRDADGDVTFWDFKVTPETVRRVPSAANARVHIWND